MSSLRLLTPSALAGAALFALPAFALAATTMPANVPANFQSAKISLSQAISTVESQTGGKVTNAVFENHNAKPGYVVTTYANGKMEAMWVDPQSGVATKIAKPSTNEAALETRDQADVSTLNTAKASLPQAISMAEQKEGGKAFEAGLRNHNNAVAYNVDVEKNGKVSNYWVDPATAKLES